MISFLTKLNYIEVKIIGAEIPRILTELCSENISVTNAKSIDEYEAVLFIRERDIPSFQTIVNRCGGEVISTKESIRYSVLQRLKGHALFIYFILALILLSSLLPSRIIFIEIIGNQKISSEQILSVCRTEGMYPGAERKEVKNEQIKNALIAQFPQIKWVGVNTHGAYAVVSIEENANDLMPKQFMPCDIVAAVDGRIQGVEVKEGEAKCRAGDEVKEGMLLISGQMDVGLCTLNKAAEGEIYAETFRGISSVIPRSVKKISSQKQAKHHVSLHFRNLKIKLWFNSGISAMTCGRISREYFLILPGGFRFPISLVVDSFTRYGCSVENLDAQSAENELMIFSDAYISESMVAGKIESVNRQNSSDDNVYCMDGIYCCHEMIGRTKAYEIGDVYGKNN